MKEAAQLNEKTRKQAAPPNPEGNGKPTTRRPEGRSDAGTAQGCRAASIRNPEGEGSCHYMLVMS